MYQLLEDVLPYFVAFYVLDSLAFVAAGEVLFARRFRRFFLDRAGPVLAGLLPVGEVVCGFDLPVRFAREGVFWPGAEGFSLVPWSGLGLVEREERTLRAAGRTLRAPSPEAAEHLVTLLVRLRDAAPARRDKELREVFEERADVAAVRERRTLESRHARTLAVLGSVLLLGLFVLVPLGLLGRWSIAPDPVHVLLAVLPVYGATVALGWTTLRRCGVPAGACLGTLSTLLFLPPAAAHVRSLLPRRLYAAFDPLAIAVVLLPPSAFRDFARERFHRLRLEAEDGGGREEHARWAEAAWHLVVAASGQTADDILKAPPALDPAAASYCPLCSTEYRRGFASCSECRVALLPFAVS